MDENGKTREDVELPDDDIGKEIKRKFENSEQFLVTILSACKDEKAVAIKNMKTA